MVRKVFVIINFQLSTVPYLTPDLLVGYYIIMAMNKKIITKKQKNLLSVIYDYIKNTGYPPTFEEMRETLNVSSNQSIIDFLAKLEKQGFIKKNEASARSLTILPLGYDILDKPQLIPFLGVTVAGMPMEANEILGEWQSVSSDVKKLKGELFLLKISGDSMINAGIDNNDVVLVKSEKEFISGDIVLAYNNGEATIKRFISNNKPPYTYLKPENPKYPIIPLIEGMEIKGKVISILKNGYWKPIKSNTKIISQYNKVDEVKSQKPYFERRDIVIYKDDILKFNSIPQSSVDLIITSPPYNIDIHYNSNGDNLTYEDYLDFTKKWIKKCFDLAKNEGRFLLNIPLDKNKGGQKSVGADITKIAKDIGWKYHSTIIWNEGNISRRTAWGS